MDYPFENLSPEKFQLFCQALLTREYPNVRCLPIGQPDGGRDAVQWQFLDAGKTSLIVFQVKFSRAPLAEDDPHKWLMKISEEEAPKIKKLLPAGAKQYVLITNIPGTAHPGVGSIDKLDALLTRQMGISSVCWWRNDLARRLDSAWDLKWTYPELMTGPDLIRLVVEHGLAEDKQRRASAVRAFVTNQHSLDREVKFKQVELQNKLLDLFIDVPIERGDRFYSSRAPHTRRYSSRRLRFSRDVIFRSTEWYDSAEVDQALEAANRQEWAYSRGGRVSTTGSALFLLSYKFSGMSSQVVLEGAPGQGKSTITQYICQVHRMKLLGVEDELQAVPHEHKDAPLRLPMRVDLRDLASWLARENPFTPEGGEIAQAEWNKSLEGFLAALIHYQSGGAAFDVSDLQAVARLSAMLVVFDGLDEVADIKKRQEVVDEIVKGVERLKSVAASLQVIVTSRPAAFANSPGLPEASFEYYDLAPVTPELIDDYAIKWVKARQLQDREANEVRRILKEKLTQPHLRDLARNPMQLAILLSLIHTRGTSLPDKRTALYDSYIELFFNREAEKSPIVRDNRELLINIHRYLAWMLHSEAELGSAHEAGRRNGAIASERLIATLRDYLSDEGHDPGLADALFKGMVERVVALVSRIQGTYEFEVQPLREYFAARYLYETAPYSPPGGEKTGTKPDRFDAIARDFYWLNVTRFYAGCYSKGELASLIDRLEELVNDKNFRLLSHPRILGSILLSDWVFSQHPRSVKEVVELVLDGIGLRYVLASNSRRSGTNSPLVLSVGCGKNALVSHCMSLLSENPPMDLALDLIDVLKANASPSDLMSSWLKDSRREDFHKRAVWLEHGLQLGCLPSVAADELADFKTERPLRARVLKTLMRARRSDVFEAEQADFEVALDGVLALHGRALEGSKAQRILEIVSHAVSVRRYAIAFAAPQSAALSSTWEGQHPIGVTGLSLDVAMPDFDNVRKAAEFLKTAIEQGARAAAEWATQLAPWDALVEKGRSLWGERWALYQIANLASGIRASQETAAAARNLFDSNMSLCQRARYARLRAGVANWWPKQVDKATNMTDRAFLVLLWASWGSPATLSSCSAMDRVLQDLPHEDWNVLFDAVQEAVRLTQAQSGAREASVAVSDLPKKLSERTVALLSLRANSKTAEDLYVRYLRIYKGDDLRVLTLNQASALKNLKTGSTWTPHLAVISRCFKKGVVAEPYAYQAFHRRATKVSVPLSTAAKIMERADLYPSYLVATAEARCKQDVATRLVPVARTAERERWFDR
jgi:hypothetical protein